ncbi:MAG: alanine/glycine:cation symporter family protein [Butyricicoccus sp.]
MELLFRIRYALWGPFTVLLILATGAYLTMQSRFVQLWCLPRLLHPNRRTVERGGISPWQALCTSLGGTLGVGNLAGVAIAITFGGPGAVFYMLLAAFFGMATKYAELLLAVRYQISGGAPLGGPMVYLTRGAGLPGLARLFALCCVLSALGTGAAAQGGAIAEALSPLVPVPPLAIGVCTAALLLPILYGGGQRIARASSVLVPVMTVLYLAGGAAVLVRYRDRLPNAFSAIFQGAADPLAAGGGILGLLTAHAVADGFAKGVFSNEAGMGSAPIAHGCTAGARPCEEGLLGAVEVFLDTFVVCLMTALVILVTGAHESGKTGLAMTIAAYEGVLGRFASGFIAVTVVFLAASTVLGWSFYGLACLRWLRAGRLLRAAYPLGVAVSVAVASRFPLTDLLTVCDISAALMAFPNLYGLWVLAPEVRRMTDAFLREHVL